MTSCSCLWALLIGRNHFDGLIGKPIFFSFKYQTVTEQPPKRIKQMPNSSLLSAIRTYHHFVYIVGLFPTFIRFHPSQDRWRIPRRCSDDSAENAEARPQRGVVPKRPHRCPRISPYRISTSPAVRLILQPSI